ncbi:MAG TPA: DUF5655 domain-containing protein [Nocardioides sp.]|nr:DUF5655 domain-containing protein [Nocardioides sp.]
MTERAMDVAERDFFEGDPVGREIHGRILDALGDLSDLRTKVSASQIAYRHGRTFAIVWRPDRYLPSEVPLVLSLVLPEPLGSPRPKEIVRVARDACMHHLELRSADEVD